MRCKILILLGITALAGFPLQAQAAPILGSAEQFAVLGGQAVTNTGAGTTIYGDVGVSPGSSVTGLLDATQVLPTTNTVNPVNALGTIHSADAAAAQAQVANTNAYLALAGLLPTANLTGQDLGGLTLTPGIYKFDNSAQLTGTLTLNALGNDDAFWVFQISSSLTTAPASSVVFTGLGPAGGDFDGLFWQVGSSATLDTTTSFAGNILALASITLNNGATIDNGRALAQTGAVTLINNTISIDSPAPNKGPGLSGGLEFNAAGQLVPTGGSGAGQPLPTGTPVPEPSTLLIFCAGMAGLLCSRKRILAAPSSLTS